MKYRPEAWETIPCVCPSCCHKAIQEMRFYRNYPSRPMLFGSVSATTRPLVHLPACQLFLNCDGLIPTCSLKYFPIKLWLAKFISSAICLMLIVLFFNMTRSSRVT